MDENEKRLFTNFLVEHWSTLNHPAPAMCRQAHHRKTLAATLPHRGVRDGLCVDDGSLPGTERDVFDCTRLDLTCSNLNLPSIPYHRLR